MSLWTAEDPQTVGAMWYMHTFVGKGWFTVVHNGVRFTGMFEASVTPGRRRKSPSQTLSVPCKTKSITLMSVMSIYHLSHFAFSQELGYHLHETFVANLVKGDSFRIPQHKGAETERRNQHPDRT